LAGRQPRATSPVMRGLRLLFCLLLPLPAAAQSPPAVLDVAGIVALAEQPWMGRRDMLTALEARLPGFDPDPRATPARLSEEDPWFWSIIGSFGANRPDLPASGGVVTCARYGVDTRDRFATADLSTTENFTLFRFSMAAHDDAEVWPEQAVARLSCMITWDDTRRVAILPRDAVLPVLEQRFDRVDLTQSGANADVSLYGAEGYRAEAIGGSESSLGVVESLLVELRVTHQRISFRSFLLGGGV